MVPVFNRENVRQILVDDYRIVYEVTAEAVEVWMVIHVRREFPPPNITDRKLFP